MAGYRQIKQVDRRDRQWHTLRMLSQLLTLVLVGIAAWVVYGSYHSLITWPWMAAYWAVQAAKNLCDFVAGRWKL